MSEEKRFYTFIVAPSAKARFHRISIHYNYLYAVLALVLGLMTVFAVSSIWVVKQATTITEFNQIQKENLDLKKKNLENELKIEKLSARISNLGDQTKKLSQANGLQHADDIDSNLGYGGPATFDVVEKATEQLETALRTLDLELDKRRLQVSTTPRGWPVQGYLTDHFGMRRFGGRTEFHPGLDISVPSGTAVSATADGLIVYAAWRNGYGNVVVIDHGNGLTTRYGHLSAIDVAAGQRIRRGDVIGRAGSTGRSTGPHVHYEVRENNVALNPMRFSNGN